ncbi:MAG: hypothetical protein ACOYIF_12105 [Acetivibrionales bacterium]|jgi:membrane protein implicated in regulation of membrane protease activity
MLENILWMLILMAFAAIVGVLIFRDSPKKIWLIVLAQLALVLRFIFVIIIFQNGTEYSGTDGLLYHQVAKDIADQIESGVPVWNLNYEYTWYTVLVGIQYAIFGVNRYAASFINSFISILTGYYLVAIALNLKSGEKKSFLIGIVYMFIPSMIVWTSDTRKESLIFFLIIMIWYMALKVIRDRQLSVFKQSLLIIAICMLIWLSTLLRIYMLYTLSGALFVYLMLHYIKTKRKLSLIFFLIVIVLSVVINFTTVRMNMRDYHALSLDRSKSGDEDLDEEIGSIFKTIMEKDIADSINSFLTKPHFKDVPYITDIAANTMAIIVVKIEMLLWYLCLLVSVFGIFHALIRWDSYLIGMLAFVVSYGLINALISENVADTYYRYRAAITAPVLLFADYRSLFQKLKTLMIGKPYHNEITIN